MIPCTLPPDVHPVALSAAEEALRSSHYDALLLVGPAPLSSQGFPTALISALRASEQTNRALRQGLRPLVACLPCPQVPGERLVLSTTGSLLWPETDVRTFAQATAASIRCALEAGARCPLLWPCVPAEDPRFVQASTASLLAALAALWQPLEIRAPGAFVPLLDRLGLVTNEPLSRMQRSLALEQGRIAARDITGTEPERMTAEAIARYCEMLFEGTSVRVTVERDQEQIAQSYPLIAAVGRASLPVQRHHPRIVRLSYEGSGAITRNFFFAGKGLTYDTGGADLKVDGHMAGMSRDKGGAGALVGLFQFLAQQRPKDLRAVALLGNVRNSIGSHSFVTDEILTGRSGLRIRVGNTDAEGRLVLADLLAALWPEATQLPNAVLASVATLTGHAALAFGPCTVAVENAKARELALGSQLELAGESYGDPLERSRLRTEDYAFIAAKSPAEDVISCNSLPSSRTPRGHQFPVAFLDIASGLRAHCAQGGAALPFVHLDIAGSAVTGGSWQSGIPTGAPLVALCEGWNLA
jgi:leucyl aminopeptidase